MGALWRGRNSMMTPFGKAVRHIRIEHEMLLGNMADILGISAAYASQIENGKRPIPTGYFEKIVNLFRLNQLQAAELQQRAVESTSTFTIEVPASSRIQDRMLANELATEFARLTPEAKSRIHKIVRGE